MRTLEPTHASVDDYQLERRDIGLNETDRTRDSRERLAKRMPSKRQPGYGDQAITLEEWRAVYR